MHESPANMLFPLVVLATLSVIGGWLAAPLLIGGANYFDKFLAPVFSAVRLAPAAEAASGGAAFLAALLGAPVIAALVGFLIAWWLYIRRPELPQRIAASLNGFYKLLLGKYFVDELYGLMIVRPLLWISTQVFWHGADERVIDGTVNGVAHDLDGLGERLRHLNSGNTRTYAVWVLVGAVAVTTMLVWAAR